MIRRFSGFVRNNTTDKQESFSNLSLTEIAGAMIDAKQIKKTLRAQYNTIVKKLEVYCVDEWKHKNMKINKRLIFSGRAETNKHKEIPSLLVELREL